MEQKIFREIIDFAIGQEHEAAQMYEQASNTAVGAAQRIFLEELAATERMHEFVLAKLSQSGDEFLNDFVRDLHVADFLVEKGLDPAGTLQDLYIFAIKAEGKAAELYASLARIQHDSQAGVLFGRLATEEDAHRAALEADYEKTFTGEN